MGTASDRELLAACARGDRNAFAELMGRHGKAVLAFARSRVPSRDDADDIAQEAFVLLWERRSRVMLATDSALPWLLVTVRLKALDRAKTIARRRTDSIESVDAFAAPPAGEPPELATRRALAAAVSSVVDGLSPIDRALLERCLADGESYESVAAAPGLTRPQVRGRLARLRIRLRGQLASAREEAEP